MCLLCDRRPYGSIGYAIAERLGREGARVMVSSRKQANVDQAVKQLKVRVNDLRSCPGSQH